MDPALIVKLADEGIPVRAIARALNTPSEQVIEACQDALANGKILEMPKHDWPAHTRIARSPQFLRDLPEDMKYYACMSFFKIPRTQATILLSLLDRPYCPREHLHSALQQSRDPAAGETSIKMVDVVLCHLRKRLKKFNIDIETVWGTGYRLTEENRGAIVSGMEAHVRTLVDTDAPVQAAA